VAQGDVARGLGAAQQVGQALHAVQRPQAARQVDPVPRLLHLVVGQAALQLPFEDAPGLVGAQLGQGADLHHVLHPRAQAGLDGRQLAALQQVAEAGLGRVEQRLAELPALEQVDVLPRDGGQFLPAGRPPVEVPPQQEGGRRQHRHDHRHDHDRYQVHGVHPSVISDQRSVKTKPSLSSAFTDY
jgi:hypothetical protein